MNTYAQASPPPRPVELGRFIVADPHVCHGQPVFKGSRVMVRQVVEQVALGMPWEQIAWSWRGKVTPEAIREALELAGRSLHDSASRAHPRRKLFRARGLAPA